ncbi:MAG: HAD hydrolase family protein [bacterium]|nr:HAD hydrolase family protein [bacterium]
MSQLEQSLIFTGLNGSILDAQSICSPEAQQAFRLLEDTGIPLIFTSHKSARDVEDKIGSSAIPYAFVIESGAAIYIPKDLLTIKYSFSKRSRGCDIIEFGIDRKLIHERLGYLYTTTGGKLWKVSDLKSKRLREAAGIKLEDLASAKYRKYTEPVVFNGDIETLKLLYAEIENLNLHLVPLGNHFLLTGDHDTGGALRFIVQLYREEYPDREIKTIGIGDSSSDGPMLYAVDQPILVRNSRGGFDGHIGRRGIKFTRNSGILGWSQAITALIGGSDEV